MNINLKNEVCGRFNMIVRKENNDEIMNETGWFNNCVLNQGLDYMANNTWFNYCKIGTGNSTPIETQTSLDKFFAVTTSTSASEYGSSTSAPYYRYLRQTFRFPAGTFNNTTLAEVAIAYSATKDGLSIWNRALIKDNNGNNTTITLLSDEVLDVVCEVRMYIDPNDVISNLDLYDRNNNLISSHTLTIRSMNMSYSANCIGNGIGNNCGIYYAYSGGIGNISSAPSGSLSGSASTTTDTYINGSCKMNFTSTFALTAANGKINALALYTSSNPYQYQIGIDPAITKTSDQTLTIKGSLSWGRYTGNVS